jgi:hypothetical protein
VAGALYFNSVAGVMNVYTGAAWVAAYVSGTGFVAKTGDTMTGALGVMAGSVSAPGIFASGDTNTGIFFPAADTFNISTNGITALSVSTGQVVTLTNALPVASGGTGQTTATAAFDAIAPSQTSNSGKYLTTNGTTTSWGTVVTGFTSGTLMLFVQTAAPTGWTKSTTHNDKALRVVSGTATTGGSAAFTTAFGTPSVSGSLSGTVGSTTLSTAQIPSHTHTLTYNTPGANVASNNVPGGVTNGGTGTHTTNATGGGGSHDHSFSGSLSSATAAINVAYVDVIIATKD